MNRYLFDKEMLKNPHMSEREIEETYRLSLNACDWTIKSIIIMEELAELAKEVSKGLRKELDDEFADKIALMEEMADVYICLEFLKKHYHISDYCMESAITVKLRHEREKRLREEMLAND